MGGSLDNRSGTMGAGSITMEREPRKFRERMSAPAGRGQADPGAGAHHWYLAEANRGQQLLDGGRVRQAAEVFAGILGRLEGTSSYERAAILYRLGRCFHLSGRPDLAAACLREAIGVTSELALDDDVKGLRVVLYSGLGDVLSATGELGDAPEAYAAALKMAEQLGDRRAQSVDLSHLGALALVEGRLEEAQAHYRAALRLSEQIREPAMAAAAWHQLGRVLQLLRQWDEAERHYREAARLREAHRNLAGAAHSWHQLGVLHQEAGDGDAAEAWYRRAIGVARQIGDLRLLSRDLEHLADLVQAQPGRLAEARHLAEEALGVAHALDPAAPEAWKIYGILAAIADKEAAACSDQERRAVLQARARDLRQVGRHGPQILAALARIGDAPSYGRAVILGRLGRCFRMSGRPDLAIAQLREAISIAERIEPGGGLEALRVTFQIDLGDALSAIGEYGAASTAYQAGLELAQNLGDAWAEGGALARIAALALAEGNPEEAAAHTRAALELYRALEEPAMEAAAWHQLGRILEEQRHWDEAERHYRKAARLSEVHGSLTGAAQIWKRLAALYEKAGDREAAPTWFRKALEWDQSDSTMSKAGLVNSPDLPPGAAGMATEETSPAAPFEVTLYEDVAAEYVFDPNLLLDGPRERRITRWSEEPDPLADGVRPMLAPGARTYVDDKGAVCFCLPPGEPSLERHPGFVAMRRTRREVAISGSSSILWRLIRRIDGARTAGEMLSEVPPSERAVAGRLLGALAATGAVEVSGRPMGRFLHCATKKGVLPGGGLESDELMRLVTDGHRAYPEASPIAVRASVPERLRGFHELTRARRSRREYLGLALRRDEFDALLHTACGVTGATSRGGREMTLRAYPSSGALYAVEIYPVVLRVEGLEPGVYHYHVVDNVLETVKPNLDHGRFVAAALPAERGMVAGAAAMVCLTGFFPRHERKYGEGGYRMMVAEAGHVSQNLILAATALGLGARPFGGVFDALLNHDLGLDEAEEQFLLAVLIGRRPDGREIR